MTDIINVLKDYQGSGALLTVYAIMLVYLLIFEKNKRTRVFLVYVPLVILVLFFLPPFFKIYSAVEQAGTYYRFLWLLPMSVTIAYSGVSLIMRFPGKLRYLGYAIFLAAVVACGSNVYENANVLAAENLQNVPHQVVDICEYLLADSDGGPTKAAFPSNIVQFVRQYTTEINMPYGRDMLIGQDYYNAVYEVMEKPEVINAEDLADILKETDCNYVVLDPAHEIDGDLEDYGFEYVITLDGFNIYKNPEASTKS